MARHYAPKAVMRHLPLALIRNFMAQENITPTKLCQPAWDALTEGDVPALYRAWCELPPGDRERFEVMLRQVHEMATEAGVRQMLAEADHRNYDIADGLDAIDGLHAKALWVYTFHRLVFHTASQLLAAASPVGRFWNLTTGFGPTPYDASPGALNELRAAVARLYREQGRGHRSTVEHYERDRCLYVFLYLDDYTETHTAHNPTGTLTRAPLRPAFEVVYVYTPAAPDAAGGGTLDMYARGDRRWRSALRDLFCEHVLRTRAPFNGPERRSYQLNGLIDRTFPLDTDPARGIVSATIRKMRVVAKENIMRKVVLEADPARERDVYDMLDVHFPVDRFPRDELFVNMVTFTIQHLPPGADRVRPLTFDVSFPDACNLKSLSPDHRAVGEWCLRQWGILCDEELEDRGDEDDTTDGPADPSRAA